MARGNQRDKAREKNQKAAASVGSSNVGQKSKNTESGAQRQARKDKEREAALSNQQKADKKKAAEKEADRLAKIEAKTKKPVAA